MGLHEMSQTRMRAWLAAIIWAVAGVGFFVTFFSGGGPGEFADDSLRHLAGAGALGFGFLGYWLALLFTRQRRGEPPVSDERDMQVVAGANQTTLVVDVVSGLWECDPGIGDIRGGDPGPGREDGWTWVMA